MAANTAAWSTRLGGHADQVNEKPYRPTAKRKQKASDSEVTEDASVKFEGRLSSGSSSSTLRPLASGVPWPAAASSKALDQNQKVLDIEVISSDSEAENQAASTTVSRVVTLDQTETRGAGTRSGYRDPASRTSLYQKTQIPRSSVARQPPGVKPLHQCQIKRVGTSHRPAQSQSQTTSAQSSATGSDVLPLSVPKWLQVLASKAMADPRIRHQTRTELTRLFDYTPAYTSELTRLFFQTHKVAFCQTCLGRAFQLRLSLPVNLALAWPWRQYCRFFLVVFDEDRKDTQELLGWIQTNLQEALECDLLTVAVGDMQFWDASKAKNTAHNFAIDAMRVALCDEPYLVNLDGDNIMYEKWLPWLMQTISNTPITSTGPPTGLHAFRGLDGGCTGRVGVWKNTFLAINGYEEKFKFPSAFEDIEITWRASCLPGSPHIPKFKYKGPGKAYPGCGYSISNADRVYTDNTRGLKKNDPRLLAKTLNCDPDRCKGKHWYLQNSENIIQAESFGQRCILECATLWKSLISFAIWCKGVPLRATVTKPSPPTATAKKKGQ